MKLSEALVRIDKNQLDTWVDPQELLQEFKIDVGYNDIAETDIGNKVVEYNQFSTSAMYACDQAKIIDALEKSFS